MPSLVSIIIPAYNAEQWITETLNSALSQTWPNTEIIVIDDGSTDNTLKIAQGFSSSRVKIIAQENRGAAAARNRGLLEAQGDYIQYLDADDLLAADKLTSQLKMLSETGNSFVASGSWAVFDDHISGCLFNPEPLWSDFTPVDWVCSLFERTGTMFLHAWLLPRDITEKAGPWDTSLSLNDDREYFNRVVLASAGVRFCSEAKCYYRIANNGSLSKRRDRAAWESAWRVCELGIASLLGAEDSERTRRACATELAGFAISFYMVFPESVELVRERIHRLGVRSYVIPFGGTFGIVSRLVGWENALKMKNFLKPPQKAAI